MNHSQSPGHSTTIEINASSEQTFDYLKQPLNLGKWALGSWNTEAAGEQGLYTGTSLFTNEKVHFKIEADEKLGIVDFHVGDPASLQPRISARVVPRTCYGRNGDFCLVTLNAWRDVGMDDERWHQLCVCHETEVLLIKALVERSN